MEKLKIDPNVPGDFRYDTFQYKKVSIEKSVKIGSISFGNSVFGNEVAAFVLKDPAAPHGTGGGRDRCRSAC